MRCCRPFAVDIATADTANTGSASATDDSEDSDVDDGDDELEQLYQQNARKQLRQSGSGSGGDEEEEEEEGEAEQGEEEEGDVVGMQLALGTRYASSLHELDRFGPQAEIEVGTTSHGALVISFYDNHVRGQGSWSGVEWSGVNWSGVWRNASYNVRLVHPFSHLSLPLSLFLLCAERGL